MQVRGTVLACLHVAGFRQHAVLVIVGDLAPQVIGLGERLSPHAELARPPAEDIYSDGMPSLSDIHDLKTERLSTGAAFYGRFVAQRINIPVREIELAAISAPCPGSIAFSWCDAAEDRNAFLEERKVVSDVAQGERPSRPDCTCTDKQPIRAVGADDRDLVGLRIYDEDIGAVAAMVDGVACATVEDVSPGFSDEDVLALAAEQFVGSGAAQDDVVLRRAGDLVASLAADD